MRTSLYGLLAVAGVLASCTQMATREADLTGGNAASAASTGKELYLRYCASCHGDDGRGNGPVSPMLTVPVPDLTQIAARRGGEFEDDEMVTIVDGLHSLPTHGSRHMPVWGYEFFGDDPDDEIAHRQARDKVKALVAYLRSIQAD